jgi:hypothetical protein
MRLFPALRPLITVLVWSSLARAAELPSQVDLRAAYCVAILQDSYSASLVASMGLTDPKDKERPQKRLTDTQANLRRLQLYLLPRLSYLDPSGLLAATTSGKEDVARLKAHQQRCQTFCVPGSSNDPFFQGMCMLGCQVAESREPTLARIRVCESLNWLPFLSHVACEVW